MRILRRYIFSLLVIIGLITACRNEGPIKGDELWRAPDAQGRWMTWAASEPAETNPNFGPARFCGRNQPKDVWFLSNSFGGERTCTIPAGRPIVFPVIYFITGENKKACKVIMADAEGHVVLDGRKVTYGREENDYITYTSAKDNPLDGLTGKGHTYLCGLWVYLPPPSAGEHSLSIQGYDRFNSMSADWTLIVK
ncbi:hypothetical protein ACQP25_14215 [Microtetraspora malaysiensis]|uniref:hypothetical protein n=1 Tax=Microtetraspora malaysiensis TaxID=161358 RepID=UPI003D8E9898